jgi:large subunit ribosomal protein L16
MLFELEGVPQPVARRAMELAAAKLPVKTKFIVREAR